MMKGRIALAALALAAVLLLCGCMSQTEEAAPANKTRRAGFSMAQGNRTNQTRGNATITPPNITLTNVGQALFTWEPYKCNYTNRPSLSLTIRTEMWMDQGRYRADVAASTKRDKTHVVSDGDTIYVWNDDTPVGEKYEVADILGLSAHMDSADLASNRTVPINTDTMDIVGAVNVSCRPMHVNWSMFEPPKNMQFRRGQGVYDKDYDSRLDRYAKAWEKPAT
jgi:hypothetical protein